MKNNNTGIGKIPTFVSRKPIPKPWLAGYADVYARLGFRAAYDTWTKHDQSNYENGRLIAINIRSADIKLPAPRFTTWSPTFVTAYRAANEKVGRAHDVVSIMASERFEETVTVY